MTRTWCRRRSQPVKKALRDAGLARRRQGRGDGGRRDPHARMSSARSANFFGQEPLTNLDPDKVVALGAAMQANVLAGNRADRDDWLLLDVIPLSLGLETMGGLVEKVIPRNSTHADRARAGIHHLQGRPDRDGLPRRAGRARARLRLPLAGALRAARHPPMVAGAARIRVTFQVDADGLLSVSARARCPSGVEASVLVKPSYGLSDDEIAEMLRSGADHAMDDMAARACASSRSSRPVVEATEQALAHDGHLLSTTESARSAA